MKRVKDNKKLYEYLIANGKSVSEARQTVLLNTVGLQFYKIMAICEERHGINLMPIECINVMEEVYGKKMETFKPQTIFNKVYNLMTMVDSNPCKESINESVEFYLN
jgi:hypothetical protein